MDGYLQEKLPDSEVNHSLFIYSWEIKVLSKYSEFLLWGGEEDWQGRTDGHEGAR